jgi:hypothetical protein
MSPWLAVADQPCEHATHYGIKRITIHEWQRVGSAYQSPAISTFLSEQTSHQQPASSTFLSEQISTSHQPPAKRTGCVDQKQSGAQGALAVKQLESYSLALFLSRNVAAIILYASSPLRIAPTSFAPAVPPYH